MTHRFDPETLQGKTIDGYYNNIKNIAVTSLIGAIPTNNPIASVDPVIQFTGAADGNILIYDTSGTPHVITLVKGLTGSHFGVLPSGSVGYAPERWNEPRKNGYIAWTNDKQGGLRDVLSAFTVGQISAQKMTIPEVCNITGIAFYVGAVPTTPANCYVALYSNSLALLGVSADISTGDPGFSTLGYNRVPFTSIANNVPAGDVFVAYLCGTGTGTSVRFAGVTGSSTGTGAHAQNINNGTLTAGQARFVVNSSQTPTAMPNPFAPTANTTFTNMPWMGLY